MSDAARSPMAMLAASSATHSSAEQPQSGPRLIALEAACYRVPTDAPEADGTLTWQHTDLVVVHIRAGSKTGLGYSYASPAALTIIHDALWPQLAGQAALDIPKSTALMQRAVRNIGAPGVAAMAISAVDIALWDLKARLLEVSLSDLLGRARHCVPAYGSGGFTSYPLDRLAAQLQTWVEQGFAFVKMKVGSDPTKDIERVAHARHAIGDTAQLFVDANGAYTAKQALEFAVRFSDCGVTWFEEPVSSDDLPGLRFLRERAPAAIQIAAGEYGFDARYFRHMLEAEAVDVLQADVTRCGVSGFLEAAALTKAFMRPLSAHCAPALHTSICCALPHAAHLEYFHDHARIERLFFDGAPQPHAGTLAPDRARPGFGLELRRADLERYRQ